MFELFYGGAKGGGKTDFLLADWLQCAREFGKAARGVIFRKTYDELGEIQRRAVDLFPSAGGKYHKSGREWQFDNGASLVLRFLESDDDVRRYQGHQYNWIGFDELTDWKTPFCYFEMMSCCRSPSGARCTMRATGNPGRVGHAWVKQRFIDPVSPFTVYTDPETGLERVFIPAKLSDNIILQHKDPDYKRRLLAMSPEKRRAYLEGDWDIFAGQVLSDWRRERVVVRPFPLETFWPRFAALDWGYTSPYSLGWWCVTGSGRLVKYREWYGCVKDKHNVGVQKPARQLAEESWSVASIENCTTLVVDPSCFNKQGLEGSSIAETFIAAGWRVIKGNNNRKLGLSQLHDLLQTNDHDGRPMIMWFETCLGTIRTFPLLVYDDHDPEDVDTNGEDHCFDETKYAILSSMARAENVPRFVPTRRVVSEEQEEWDILRGGKKHGSARR